MKIINAVISFLVLIFMGVAGMAASVSIKGDSVREETLLLQSVDVLKGTFDWSHGGLVGDTKFSASLPIRFLLRHYWRTGDADALKMATLTLDRMKNGAVFDHVGGGFHSHATGPQWSVTHFAKTLYSNALLAMNYTLGFQITKNNDYKQTAKKIFDFLLAELQSADGGFYSCQGGDLLVFDGENKEKNYYSWTSRDIDRLFDKKDAAMVKRYFSMEGRGNNQHHFLHISEPLGVIADGCGITPKKLADVMDEAQSILLRERKKRAAPDKDQSIITSWNSPAISALARAGFAFNEQSYIDCAEKTARFILSNLLDGEILYHSFENGRRQQQSSLEDYSFFVAACLDLYGATADIFWLKQAVLLDGFSEKRFGDEKGGYLFKSPKSGRDPESDYRSVYNETSPSGSAMAVRNLIRLSMITHNPGYGRRAQSCLNHFFSMAQPPDGDLWEILLAVELLMDDKLEIVLITPKGDSVSTDALVSVLRKHYHPGAIVIMAEEGDQVDSFSKIIPSLEYRNAINGKATVYLCKNGVCMFPITESATLEKALIMD